MKAIFTIRAPQEWYELVELDETKPAELLNILQNKVDSMAVVADSSRITEIDEWCQTMIDGNEYYMRVVEE